MNSPREPCALTKMLALPDNLEQPAPIPHHCLGEHPSAEHSHGYHDNRSCGVDMSKLVTFSDNCCHHEPQLYPTAVPEPPVQVAEVPYKTILTDPRNLEVSETLRAIGTFEPPCYLSQPLDNVPEKPLAGPMDPIGPWATGKVDWSPLSGLTGTRPVVDRYSITRFSTNEWRKRNQDAVENANEAFCHSKKNDNDCKNTRTRTIALVDKTQSDCTKSLKDRARLVDKFKCTLERAINAQIEEIIALEDQRVRLKHALAVLLLPQSIAGECLDRRCVRPETEHVRDEPEEELVKEAALISEIRNLLLKILADVEAQQAQNRAARQRLEYDWSDKKDAHEIESLNCALNNLSTTTLFKAGATRCPAEQSSEEFWEHFTSESLKECEQCRQDSIHLRSILDAVLLNSARDLRTQADKVEKAFAERISCMEEIRTRLEIELKECLQKLADTESLIVKMTIAMQNLDVPMKVSQTRLDNRNFRPHVENCRDHTQFCLMEEIKTIQDGMTAMQNAIHHAEKTKHHLMQTREDLEREIMLKRRTILIDKERCNLIRTYFPCATALSDFENLPIIKLLEGICMNKQAVSNYPVCDILFDKLKQSGIILVSMDEFQTECNEFQKEVKYFVENLPTNISICNSETNDHQQPSITRHSIISVSNPQSQKVLILGSTPNFSTLPGIASGASL